MNWREAQSRLIFNFRDIIRLGHVSNLFLDGIEPAWIFLVSALNGVNALKNCFESATGYSSCELVKKVHFFYIFTNIFELVGYHKCRDIPWNAIVSAAADQFCACLIRDIVIFIDHLSDPVYLSGDVTVVGSRVGADCDKRGTVSCERANGWDHHFGSLGNLCELIDVGWVSNQDRDSLAEWVDWNHLSLNLVESLLISSSDRPVDRGSILSGEIPGGKFSSKACGSKKYQVEFSVSDLLDLIHIKFFIKFRLQFFVLVFLNFFFRSLFKRISKKIPDQGRGDNHRDVHWEANAKVEQKSRQSSSALVR